MRPRTILIITVALALGMGACQPAPFAATPTASPSPTATSTAMATEVAAVLEAPASPTPTLAPYPALQEAAGSAFAASPGLKPISNSGPLALGAYDHFYFSYPMLEETLRRDIPSGRYGDAQEGDSGGGHTGLDLTADIGTPVMAAAGGRVIWSGVGLLNGYERLDDPYGIAVVIRHDFGYEGQRLYTVYAHLSESHVEVGQDVEGGEVIALSGNTGFSTGPHLHFEVRTEHNTIYETRNPELWLIPPADRGVLVGRIYTTYGTIRQDQLVQVTSLDTGRVYLGSSYSTEVNVVTDAYYGENFAIGNLPAGRYEIAIPYIWQWMRTEIEIKPGAVTFFTFHGYDGYRFDLPQVAAPENVPDAED